MAEFVPTVLDPTRLLFDLQRVNAIVQTISGCLEPEQIARQLTDALVEQFDCAFARIWLVEPDQTALRLVASSGLYTHINGSFARVPMGAYKVGKIAQNRVPFLSNHLADETWVKDRDWAIANNIRGFAGYPLVTGDRVIGVLATFSHQAIAPEFLEVLQILCMTATIALDAALQSQQSLPSPTTGLASSALSDQLVSILTCTRLMLVGTERSLSPSVAYTVIRAAEQLNRLNCNYCRLTYGADAVTLTAIVAIPAAQSTNREPWVRSCFGDIRLMAASLGGGLHLQMGNQGRVLQVLLKLPCFSKPSPIPIHIQCQVPIVQTALTHLVYVAGLTVCDLPDAETIVLTDLETALAAALDAGAGAIWMRSSPLSPVPAGVSAVIDLATEPHDLRAIVETIHRGESVERTIQDTPVQRFSEREQEIMALLAQGLRDRDIAQRLYISESTVKFHINNSLNKLSAKNRYQAVYQAAILGWI